MTQEFAATYPIADETCTFANPIAPGADPWVVHHDGFYYWCASEDDLGVAVYRSERLTGQGEKVVVWRAPENGPYSQQVWAPELHRLDGRWYIYVAASDGRNKTHRMIVLEAVGDHPTSEFRFKAELYTGDTGPQRRNRWAIDGTILEHGGQRYLLWSGWEDERDHQFLYIARMANPWTLASRRVRLCANDDHAWERIDETETTRGLNEAPQVLQRDGRVFVVYSASASWQTTYKLGLLELAPGGDPMDAGAWHKHPEPVFQATERTWGPGHNCFVKSPDGTEDWIVFHAKLETKPNWKRAIHVQRFTWSDDGRPDFGQPVDAGIAMAVPSGAAVPATAIATWAAPPASEVALGRAALAAAVGGNPIVAGVKVLQVPAPAETGGATAAPR
jgi:GH43 family beta-xylosidase